MRSRKMKLNKFQGYFIEQIIDIRRSKIHLKTDLKKTQRRSGNRFRMYSKMYLNESKMDFKCPKKSPWVMYLLWIFLEISANVCAHG